MHHRAPRTKRALTLALAAVLGATFAPSALRAADPIAINVGALPVDTSAVVFYASMRRYCVVKLPSDIAVYTMQSWEEGCMPNV